MNGAGTGLPDGIFSDQKNRNLGESSNGRRWYVLWPFGIFCDKLEYVFCGKLVYVFCGKLVYVHILW
jgi:hypothetical protein